MKKFLSLVLALVMTMSLVTISAGAKDFTDKSSITYGEAVDVVSAIGVVDGYTDGSFNPSATLTRGAAAKIICNLLLGPTTAAALSADSAPYSDVPTSNTFAGYIAYCSQQGIISGYADGTFRPAANLTGYAFLKMLLGALGYDSEIEGFVGANWSVQVAKLAMGIGLVDGNDEFIGTKPVTREEAALYAFNTLKADMVDYASKITANVGDAVVTIGNSKAEPVKDGVITPTKYANYIDDDGFTQFAEKHFTKLYVNGTILGKGLDTGVDAFQRPANVWYFDGDKIGTYALTADAHYTKNTAEADIYEDAGLTTTTTFTVYIDGVAANSYKAADSDTCYDVSSEVTVNKGDEDNKIGGGNGATVDVYKDAKKICIVNTYIGEVITVEEATAKRAAYIEIGPINSSTNYGPYNGSKILVKDYKFDTDQFEVGDIVTFNYDVTGNCDVKNVKIAESVNGKVESFTTNKKFALDGTTYEYGSKAVNYYGSSDIGTESTVYVDANGYALYAKEGKDNNKNYALVLNANFKTAISGTDHQAWLLFTDGTTKVVDTDKDYYTGSSSLKGQWVTYKINSKGETVLTVPTGSVTTMGSMDNNGTTTTTVFTENGKTDFKLTDDSSTTQTLKANSATVVIVRDNKDNFKVYEGVKNMPSIFTMSGSPAVAGLGAVAGASAYQKSSTATFAKFLYVDMSGSTTAKIDNGTSKSIFLVADKGSKLVETASDKYYVFDAVVDGKIVEDGIMLDYTDTTTKTLIDTKLTQGTNVLLSTYAVSNGFYTVDIANEYAGTKGNKLTAGTVEKVSGNCIDFNGSTYYTADDCVFYRVDAAGNLKQTTISGFRSDSVGGTGYYKYVAYTYNSDAELTGVYWAVAK